MREHKLLSAEEAKRSPSARSQQPEQQSGVRLGANWPLDTRDRLVDVLRSERAAFWRTQTALAAVVLAVSGATSAGAAATGPGQKREGEGAPAHVRDLDGAQNPDFDPGGKSTDLPFDVPPPPQSSTPPSTDNAGPIDQQPTTNTSAPIADPGDQPATPAPQAQPTAPPAPQIPAAAVSTPASPTAPQPPIAAGGPPTPNKAGGAGTPEPQTDADTNARKPHVTHERENLNRHVSGREGAADISTTTSTAATVETAPAPTPTAPARRNGRSDGVNGRHRSYVVRPGDSLWSIAADLLGDRASAARIALEVNRLWQLNKQRIGTGNPDLLIDGTKLRLR